MLYRNCSSECWSTNIICNKNKFAEDFFEVSYSSYGIACCYAQFKVPLLWELSVAVYPELVEGSLTLYVLNSIK